MTSTLTSPPRTNSTHPAPSRTRKVSMPEASLMVAEREIVTQVKSKSFVISLAITLILVAAGIVVSGILADRTGSDTEVAVVGEAADVVAGAPGLAGVPAENQQAAEDLVRSEEVEAAIVPDADSPVGVRLIALTDAPSEVVAGLSVSPPVDVLDTSTSDGLRYLVSIAFGMVFMMFSIGSGAMIVQNTVQEKQSRIVEILLSAVPARALLAGKVLGNSALAVGQTMAIAAVAVLALLLTGQGELLDLLTAPIVWFVVFFLFGFVLVAALFAAGAALVSRQEDTGTVMMPTMMLVMLPYFVVIFLGENRLAMTIASYVPFSAPVAMPVRMFMNEAHWWEPLLSLGLLAGAAAIVVTIAAKIYTRSLLQTGTRVSLKQALAKD